MCIRDRLIRIDAYRDDEVSRAFLEPAYALDVPSVRCLPPSRRPAPTWSPTPASDAKPGPTGPFGRRRTAAEEPGEGRRPAHVTGPRGRLPFVTWTPRENRYGDTAYRRVGRSGLQLPTISLGLWNNFGDDRPLETQRAILRRAFDLGITHFDLANNYGPPPGSAEANFGRILDTDFRGYRDELVLSTKAGYDMWPGPYGEWGSRKYLLASLDQSLRRMGVDYVDIFYSHRFDPDTPLEETMGALDTAVRQGKALYAGISSYSPGRTREAAGLLRDPGTPPLISQPSYSMFNRWPPSSRRVRSISTRTMSRPSADSPAALSATLRTLASRIAINSASCASILSVS